MLTRSKIFYTILVTLGNIILILQAYTVRNNASILHQQPAQPILLTMFFHLIILAQVLHKQPLHIKTDMLPILKWDALIIRTIAVTCSLLPQGETDHLCLVPTQPSTAG